MTHMTVEPTAVTARPSGREGVLRERLVATMPLLVLGLLLLVIGINEPSFLRPASIGTIIQISAPITILALGQTFVILTGGIDLSQAVLASFGTVLVALWIGPLGGLGVVLAVLAITAAGLLNGAVSAYAQVPSFIVTLGSMGFWGAVAMLVSGATTISITAGHDTIGWLATTRLWGIPLGAVLAVVASLVVGALLPLLARGNVFHAMGLAEAAALLSGVRTRRVRVLAFGISALCAGCAAVMMSASQYSGSPTLANSLLLPVIAAVVIGGTAITGGVGGPLRSLVGALVIGVLRVGMGIVGVNPAFEQIMYGAGIIVAVAFTLDRSRVGIVK